MKKMLALLLLIFSFYLSSFSQKKNTVNGVAFDTTLKQPVPDATITIMKKKDSSLVIFTMAGSNGKFAFTGLAEGDYRLLITHINYWSSNTFFTIDKTHNNVDLGNIAMQDKNKVLKEVSVTAESIPVTLIGDTIQYNAGSFKTLPNSSVEDLLKKLPGIKVEKDGTVKAQGEKVKKVLVDGKEFFGNDPKVATKNLPADAIDKVQVFDKLSDQAQMTGFDDGNSEKTINLTLKKDKKKGAFGKINAGPGTGNRYQEKLNVNSFKGARQLSVIGMGNNSNAEGFTFSDILNFTGAINQLKNGGNMNIIISQDDPLSGLLGANSNGINTTWAEGINYNNIIGAKTDFQGNYFYSRFNPNRVTNTQRQFFTPANLYNQNSYADNVNNSHRLNFSADHQIDSFTSIKISGNFNYQNRSDKTVADYSTFTNNGTAINNGNSNNLSNTEGSTISANILFRKKFHTRGRSFSFNLLGNFNKSTGDGSMKSITRFNNAAGFFFRNDSIDQQNNNAANLNGFNARAVYTEPLFKKYLLEFSAGKSFTINTANKTTYDFNNSSGKFDLINAFLTNNFKNTYGYTTGGVRLRKQTRKYNYAFGATWQQAALQGKVVTASKDSLIKKRFIDVLPAARFQYKFSQFKNIMLTYNTATSQPTIAQLQPVADNSNPLYVKQGNPNLRQEFVHTLRLNASIVDPFKNKNLFAFFTLQQTQNKIVNYDIINNLGIDSVIPVNINGVFNMNGNASYSFPVHFLKGTFEISADISSYHGRQFINTLPNTINTFTFGPQVRLDMAPADKLNVSLSGGFSHSQTKYSLPSARNAKYFIQEYGAEISWQLPVKFLLASDLNYRINNQYADGFNTRIPLWNAAISKQILHFNRGELKLSANDILNKNVSINRSTSQNYIEDTRVNSLRRFFMLSFTYSLTKTGLNNSENDGVRRMR